MVIDMLIEENIAKLFHDTYEELAPYFGYKTRQESAVPWDDVPEENKQLMVATVKAVLTKANLNTEIMELLEELTNAVQEGTTTFKLREKIEQLGYIKKPEKCDKCGDSGKYNWPCKECGADKFGKHDKSCTGYAFPERVDKTHNCPCRDNPQSMYNLLNGGVI
jgi:hypothetical protein